MFSIMMGTLTVLFGITILLCIWGLLLDTVGYEIKPLIDKYILRIKSDE